MEFRQAQPVQAEYAFRSAADGSPIFEGYAAVFDRPSQPITDQFGTGYVETIRSSAFRRTLASGKRQLFVVDHDEKQFISATDGALRLTTDSKGLLVESKWPNVTHAANVRALYDQGERLSMSFTSRWTANGHSWDAAHRNHEVSDTVLRHVTVLTYQEPAFADTMAGFRSLAERTEADVEDIDELVEALKAGNPLTDAQGNLLTRLAAAVVPADGEAAQAEPQAEEIPAERTVAFWRAKLDEVALR